MDELTQRIIDHEGLKLFPYKDSADKLTIGIGRNIQDRGISRDEALYLLNNDIALSRRELSHFDWFNAMIPVRQDVLVELHFNIGLAKVLEFKTMIAFLEHKYYLNASTQLLNTLWAKEVGENRANDMAYRLKTGTYNDQKIQ